MAPTTPATNKVNKGLSEVLSLRVMIHQNPYITPVPRAAMLAKLISTKPGLITTKEPYKTYDYRRIHLLNPTFSPKKIGEKAVTTTGATKARVNAFAKEM